MKLAQKFLLRLWCILALSIIFLPPALSGQRNVFRSADPRGQVSQQAATNHPQVVPGVVVVKITSRVVAQSMSIPSAATGLASLDAKLQRVGATSVQKMFRHKPIPAKSGIPDISRIVKVSIPEWMNPGVVARELERDPNVEYAEPVYVRRLNVVPNDPMYAQQQHLPQIDAPEAWDVQKGDSAVIISIVDTGVDYDHEDLAANVWTNEAEANGIPGADDDGNGFVDDVHGWDFGDNDPDPTDLYGHGTHCAGIACAVTNNLIGIAGVSWNCKYMPVKVASDDTEYVWHGYDGIIYAADNGADVISNSWGGPGYSKWEQEVVNYANGKGAIVVCGAGNDNGEIVCYPASYQRAVSVGSVRANDTKASYATFGPWIDICSPGGDLGAGILSTIPDDKYQVLYGTSMATPLVAGVCGLLKSLHSDWTNDQITRQVLMSADNVDALNPQYLNKLGHGRVNADRALTDSSVQEPDARLAVFSSSISDSLFGNNNGVLERGETVQLRFNIRNFSIGTTDAATLRLSCTSAGVEILNGTISPVFFPVDSTLPIDFLVKIADDTSSEIAELLLSLETSLGYSREENMEIPIGKRAVLFVDNDFGYENSHLPDVELFFRDILDENNLRYGYWDTQPLGFPGAKTLQEFPIVILSCSSGGLVLNEKERNELRTYLDGGGNLFICGQDIGRALSAWVGTAESREFMSNYLHAEFLADNSGDQQVSGVTGDVMTHGMSFQIWQLAADWQSPEVIAPTSGASTIFTYRDGRTCAVKYADTHKVVYLGFGLEAVDSDQNTGIGDPSPIRTELLLRIINWLNVINHDPRKDVAQTDTLLTVSARFSGSIPDFQTPTLFWRTAGDSMFFSVCMTDIGQRRYTCRIPAPGSGKSVDYYIETTHPYYTWTSPVTAPAALHRYPVPALITVDTRTVNFGRIDDRTPSLDTTFMVRNVGLSEDSLHVTLDYGNVTPDSAIAVSPRMFALVAGDSTGVTFTVRPPLLAPGYYNAAVLITSHFGSGQIEFSKLILFQKVPVGVAETDGLPTEFALEQNYPNPFNPMSEIRYQISEIRYVELVVYDLLGREVATLVNEVKKPGTYTVQFDAHLRSANSGGQRRGLASGVYLYRMQAGSFVDVKKMVLLR